jgi:hypothetical protein
VRNMAFSLTTQQVRDETKDVTRRDGWWDLKPLQRLYAVEKGMGLKKGEHIVRLKVIEIISSRGERLDNITKEEVVREGFPDMTPAEFVKMFCKTHKGCTKETEVNRIEFKYVH